VLHLGERDATLYDDQGTVLSTWRNPLFAEASAEDLLQVVRTGGGEDAEELDEVAEAAWLGDLVVVVTLEGEVGLIDAQSGALKRRLKLAEYVETDGWPGLLAHRRRGVWLRKGEGAELLPRGQSLSDPGEPVEAMCPVGSAVVRAVSDRLGRLEPDGEVSWTTALEVHLLAVGRHLYAASGQDLILLDAETGRVRSRVADVLGDAEGMASTSDGHLWAWGGVEGESLVRCLDGNSGATRHTWELPADGAVFASGAAWVWTDDGMLVRLAR
jgi:hypothetical protein